jgi:hypothetical protein
MHAGVGVKHASALLLFFSGQLQPSPYAANGCCCCCCWVVTVFMQLLCTKLAVVLRNSTLPTLMAATASTWL